jgi:hypothetical protein
MKVLDSNSKFRVVPTPSDARSGAGRPQVTTWFAPLVAALYETRRIQAEREIARHSGLLDGLRPDCASMPRGR